MDEHALKVLEFHKVVLAVSARAVSEPGQIEAAKLRPSTDIKEVTLRLKEAEDLKKYLSARREFPIRGLRDISAQLKKAAVEGAALSPEELLHVFSVARTSRLMKSSLSKARDEYPILAKRSGELSVFENIEAEISRAIGDDGEVLDSASPELKRIRVSLTQARSRINRELEGIIQDPSLSKAVQEPVITIRGERYCLPLKTNFRTYLQGIVHDHSATGSTVFVEPGKTVELNNKLVSLKGDELSEIERILWRLTATVRESSQQLEISYLALVKLDALYAVASFALETGGNLPRVDDRGYIELKDARHPLLIMSKGMESAVPLDIRLGRDFDTLVITGPNTGGKTVVLKTVGLLVLMAQAGLLIPAAPDSAIAVFDGVFSDIGDEQSVEQNLSTFSSHMNQIVRMLAGADRNSLVLLDELGAGTDPSEGSALGVAIIEELHRRGTKTVVTTHHGALKVFGSNTPGVMNASVEFDPVTLMPTYRLAIGRPGRSSAILVASRLGMPKGVLERAKEGRRAGEAELDTLIEKLEKEAQAAREDRRKAAQEALEARAEKERLQGLVRRAEDERREAVRKAKEKAQNVINQLKFKLRDLEELSKKASKASPERAEVRKHGAEIQALEEQLKEEVSASGPGRGLELEALSVGDTVKVYKYNRLGQVVEIKKDKNKVVVQLGTMRVTLSPDELELSTRAAPGRAKTQAFTVSRAEEDEDETSPGMEINIIGLRVEEALPKVQKFLDKAMLSGLGSVRIIHGRGTGALRKAIREELTITPGVKDFHDEAFDHGGDAVTVVGFK
ncbi:MAG: endonuclease MutS2 [Nitrospirota bacterium]